MLSAGDPRMPRRTRQGRTLHVPRVVPCNREFTIARCGASLVRPAPQGGLRGGTWCVPCEVRP